MHKQTTRSAYAEARALFKQTFPESKMHHLRPRIRHSRHEDADTEFNLFPWKDKPHQAWHRLFTVMALTEVWPIISDAYLAIFEGQGEMVRDWCLPYRFQMKKDIQRDIISHHPAARLRQDWVECFGSADLLPALFRVRYMALFMVLGHHACRPDFRSDNLKQALVGLKDDPDRLQAFRICFGRPPEATSLRNIKKGVRRILAQNRGLVSR